MQFLKNEKRISLKYGDTDFFELNPKTSVTENGNEIIYEYLLEDGLKITNVARKIPEFDAYEWVNWLENTGEKPSKIISELYDCDVKIPMSHMEPRFVTAYIKDFDEGTQLYTTNGCDDTEKEFCCDMHLMAHTRYVNHMYPGYGNTKEFSCIGGRSSHGRAPYFNLYRQGKGFIFAVGWTGQWNARIARNADDIHIQTKLEDTHFRLFPGEKIRTSSLVLMHYECDVDESFNKWRRFVKKEFSIVGKPGRAKELPLCSGEWGGTTTDDILKWFDIVKKKNIPYECMWMDAGWYGTSKQRCKDEFEGDWGEYLGDWRINETYHPDKLKEISKAKNEKGFKFVLWFEPECANENAPMVANHPEYFLTEKVIPHWNKRRLLNLGNPEAWQYAFDTISEKLSELDVDWYRQDFNVQPLGYWRANDVGDRQGITEIKHIMGLYRLLDSLLERFPHLMIDNCASGGKRLDIEMFKRSVPLWRSDFQCAANYDIEATQLHNMTYSTWFPYSGTGCGRLWGDDYRIRSSYGTSMTSNFGYTITEIDDVCEEKYDWMRTRFEEYRKLRPYYSEDFYPLSEKVSDRKAWCAYQYNRPENEDGIIQVFKRPNSPYTSASYKLKGLNPDNIYIIEDIDTNEKFELSGKHIMETGFDVTIKEERVAKIFTYKTK